MTVKKAVIMIGPAACGKSEAAKKYVERGYFLIESDQIRLNLLLDGRVKEKLPVNQQVSLWSVWRHTKPNEALVAALFKNNVDYAILAGRNIVVADTNLVQPVREQLIERLQRVGYQVECELPNHNLMLEQLWERDEARLHTVGRAVLADQYARYRSEFPLYPKHTFKPELPNAAVFDLDGTLAHREYELDGVVHSLRAPFELHNVEVDEPDDTVWAALFGQMLLGRHIIFVSGRDSVCREETLRWLNGHFKSYAEQMLGTIGTAFFMDIDSFLFMRPLKDQRPDHEIKKELFDEHINGKYNVVAVFDDRPQVCRFWYELGIKVIHCANPWIEF